MTLEGFFRRLEANLVAVFPSQTQAPQVEPFRFQSGHKKRINVGCNHTAGPQGSELSGHPLPQGPLGTLRSASWIRMGLGIRMGDAGVTVYLDAHGT